MADAAIITIGVVRGEEHIAPTMGLVSKGGRVVVTGVTPVFDTDVKLSLFDLTIFQKELRGSLFGACNARSDLPTLFRLYRSGQLKLDELITRRYPLEEINTGYEDMLAGRNIRGVIVHDVG
jgi:S-(hydroxymethyl)glutathione dehydrogenase/alcohol dehydrogenase